MTPESRASELANAHWTGYVKPLLEAHGEEAENIAVIGFHYVSSAVHFYKHAVADLRAGMFPAVSEERYQEIHTPLSAEEVERISREVVSASLCDSCAKNRTCAGGYLATKEGGCEGYTSSLREQIAEAKEPQSLDLRLPTITIRCNAEEAYKKYLAERQEWTDAPDGSFNELVEKWDCLQAYQTHVENGGTLDSEGDSIAMGVYHEEGRPVMQAKAAMLLKNAQRGYYSPETCAIIIASNGERWK